MDVLTFKYDVCDAKGKVIESSDEEVSIVQGSNQFLPTLEQAILEMNIGDQKAISLSASQGYGEYKSDLVFEVEKSKLGNSFKEGDIVGLKVNGGHKMKARVVDFKDSIAVLDCNHPLAGLDLVFNVTLVDRKPSEPPKE